MAEEKKGLIKEFRDFISRGNVLDMAVGVVVATAFGKITTSLVNNVIMPFVGWVCGGADAVQSLNVTIAPAVLNEAGEVVKEATVLGFGTFLAAIIDFIIIAFIVFMIVKGFNKARTHAEKEKEPEPEPEPEEKKPTTEELLAEILAQLKEQNKT